MEVGTEWAQWAPLAAVGAVTLGLAALLAPWRT